MPVSDDTVEVGEEEDEGIVLTTIGGSEDTDNEDAVETEDETTCAGNDVDVDFVTAFVTTLGDDRVAREVMYGS